MDHNFRQKLDSISLTSLLSSEAIKWSSGKDIIGAWVAEMDFGIAPQVTTALHNAVEEGAFGYLQPKLISGLQEATAQHFLQHYDWVIKPSDVRQVQDVIHAFELAIEHHSEPGSKIIVPTPTYFPFLRLPSMSGREVIEVPMIKHGGRYVFDMVGLQQAFSDGGNLLVLCNPYNPLGRIFDRNELTAISELVARNNGRVFSDEIWSALTYGGKRHIPYASINAEAASHTITANSASKAWNLPGLKCAQVILSNDTDREIWERIGFFASHGTSNLGVVANTAAYSKGSEWLANVVEYLDRNRRALSELVAEHLPGVHYHQPEGTYIAWLDFRDTALESSAEAFFRENARVQITDGATCGMGFNGFGRFIFATPYPVMVTAFERMGAAFKAR